jgi:hypothetical protein
MSVLFPPHIAHEAQFILPSSTGPFTTSTFHEHCGDGRLPCQGDMNGKAARQVSAFRVVSDSNPSAAKLRSPASVLFKVAETVIHA